MNDRLCRNNRLLNAKFVVAYLLGGRSAGVRLKLGPSWEKTGRVDPHPISSAIRIRALHCGKAHCTKPSVTIGAIGVHLGHRMAVR
jgi:hypothetical protein